MVKGISRQVIVVGQPDTKLFEQAIFILREDALGQNGVTDHQLLQEACQAADRYVRSRTDKPKKHRPKWSGLLPMLLGSALTGLAWLLTCLIF